MSDGTKIVHLKTMVLKKVFSLEKEPPMVGHGGDLVGTLFY